MANVRDGDIVEFMKWSPDGAHLAIQVLGERPVNGELQLVDGSGPRPITSDQRDITSFDWMPDSQSLVVAQNPTTDDGRSSTQIAVIDLDGHELRTVAPTPALRIWYGLTVDPSGSTLIASAAVRGAADQDYEPRLWSIDLNTGDAEMLDVDLGGLPMHPAFDSSGRVIAIVMTPHQVGGYGDDHLVAIDLNRRSVLRLTPKNDNVAEFTVRACTNSIVYTSVGPYHGGGVQPVYERSMDDASDRARVGTLRAGFVAASPVGSRLTYSTYEPFRDGPDVRIWQYGLSPCTDA